MTSPTFPRISVLVPNFNMANWLARGLESICAQDPPPHQVLLLDDCSTDNSIEIVEQFAQKYLFLRYLRYPEKSKEWIVACAQHARLLTGEYLLWFAADDLIYPGFLRTVGEAAQRYPDVGVIFAGRHFISPDLRILNATPPIFREERVLEGEALHEQLCSPWFYEGGFATVIKTELFLWLVEHGFAEMGPYADSIGYSIAALRKGALYLPQIGGGVTLHENHLSYHQRSKRDEAASLNYFFQTSRFLRSPRLQSVIPPRVADALENKVLGDMPARVQRRVGAGKVLGQARQLMSEGRLAQALELCQALARECPDLWEVFEHLGTAQFRFGQFAAAEATFRQALALDRGQANVHTNLGACLHCQGRWDEAIQAHMQALELNPEFAEVHFNLGDTLARMGRVQEAARAFRQALRIRPQYAEARDYLHRIESASPVTNRGHLGNHNDRH